MSGFMVNWLSAEIHSKFVTDSVQLCKTEQKNLYPSNCNEIFYLSVVL